MEIDSPMIQELMKRLPEAHEVKDKMEFVNNYLLDKSFRLQVVPEHHPLHQSSSRQTRLELLEGSWIEDMLMTDEVKVAMAAGKFSSRIFS